ncbi:MAG: hypothetical protein CVU56_20340 [Deltaproteobacteria bacterium HGW-Deltaproteobacteria-14]|jgi:Tol biopolymer transport system component|nr:MAG: hypothetical protein CVU56_20340 [Deltaproteobacteria bacterium HGW-Deltaproteobacteria-14]
MTAKIARLLLPLTIAWLAACSGDTTKPEDDTLTSDGTVDLDSDADGETPFDPWAAPAETDDWRVLFNYRPRPGQPGVNELYIVDPDGENLRKLTDFAKLDVEGLSCEYGCFPSPDLQWIAVADGPPDANGGFSLKLGKFNSALEVQIFKGVTIPGVIDFKFAGTRMFYSTTGTCSGPSCQYDFYVVNLDQNVNDRINFMTFPPTDIVGDSTYKGHFKVSSDGKNLVMLQTTIRSTAVYLWRDGTGVVKLDFICKYGTEGDCSGTGSEYSDLDPVAISPDNRYIVFFTFSDRWQRARIYDTQNPNDVRLAVLASVPNGLYVEHVCDAGALADWQWQRVIGDPVFSPDGDEVMFLTKTTCTADGTPPKKELTNIYRVKLDTLLSGKTLTADDVFNVTNNPPGDVTANHVTTGFALSPDGATMVFSATPAFDQSGGRIGDGTSRQRGDRELMRLRVDGEGFAQMTNDLKVTAESPMMVPPAAQ